MPSRPNVAVNISAPVNLVTESNPNLVDGSTYLIQNVSSNPIRVAEVSAAPTVESETYRVLYPGQERAIEIASATPPYAWVHPSDGTYGLLSISEAS